MPIRDTITMMKLLFSDREKYRFIIHLDELQKSHPEFVDLVRIKSENSTKYLEELFEFYKLHGDVKAKLDDDLLTI